MEVEDEETTKTPFQSRISSIKKKAEGAAAAAAAAALTADDQRRATQQESKLVQSLSSATLGSEAGSMLKLNGSLGGNNGEIPRINPGLKNKAAERREIMSREGNKSQARAHSANANLKGNTKTVGSISGGRQIIAQGGPLRSMSGHANQMIEKAISKELKTVSDNRAKVKEKQHAKAEASAQVAGARRQGSKIPHVVTTQNKSATKRTLLSETFPKSKGKEGGGAQAAGSGDGSSTEMIGAGRSLGAIRGNEGKHELKTLALSAVRPTKTITTIDQKSGAMIISTVGDSPDAAAKAVGSPMAKGDGVGNTGPNTPGQKTFVPPITLEAIADKQYMHAYAAPADTARSAQSAGSPKHGGVPLDSNTDDFLTERVSGRDRTNEGGPDGTESRRGIQVTVLDEVKAKKNDRILHQRLQEAKAMDRNRISSSGAVMHKFSLWSKAKQPVPVEGEMPDISTHNYNYSSGRSDRGDSEAKLAAAPSTPTRQPILPGPDLEATPQMHHGRKTRSPDGVPGPALAPAPLNLDGNGGGAGAEYRLDELKQPTPRRTAIPKISRSAKANVSQQLEQLVDKKIEEKLLGAGSPRSYSGASREDAASPALSEISQDLNTDEDAGAGVVKTLQFDGAGDGGQVGPGVEVVRSSQGTGVNAGGNTIQIEGIQNSFPTDAGSSSAYAPSSLVEGQKDSPLRWKRGALIGEGTFGKVYKGMNERTGEMMAVKQLSIMDGSEEDVRGLQKEISVMWHLDHDNIVRYLGTARSERYLFIVLEYVSGGSIANMLQQFGSFEEKLTRRFTMQILGGVEYLHAKGIIHRDIKGGNVLVSNEGVAKLADFGCSRQVTQMCTASMEESLQAIRGSVPWMAPEMIKQTGQTFTSDIWSVGATVIEMGTGKPPWPEFRNNLAALFHVATSSTPPAPPEHFSDKCKTFLKRCFIMDPTERATASALASDPFIAVITSPSAPSTHAQPPPSGKTRSNRPSLEPSEISIVPSPREYEGSTDEKARVAYEHSLSESQHFLDM